MTPVHSSGFSVSLSSSIKMFENYMLAFREATGISTHSTYIHIVHTASSELLKVFNAVRITVRKEWKTIGKNYGPF